MPKAPFSTPEFAFIILVMILPLVVGFAWRAESFSGFIGRVGVSAAVGFVVWAAWIFLICKRYDQKSADKRNNKTLK